MGQLRFRDDDGRPGQWGKARRGLERSVRAMGDTGRREPIDEAYIALARIGSDELDKATARPGTSSHVVATLIGRCAAVYSVLFERGDGLDGERFDELFAALRDGEESGRSDAGL